MKKNEELDQKFSLLSCFTAFLLLFMIGASPAIYAASNTQLLPSAEKKISYKRTFKTYQIPRFELVDMFGKKVVFSSLVNGDRPVLLSFIFTTCPSFCPILSATFGQVQNKFNSDDKRSRPLLISISIDPEHDTPERLKKYASNFKAGPDWMFLTGKYEVILEVQKLFGVYQGEKMNHQAVTFLHKAGAEKWLRLDGFTSAKSLLLEFQQLISDKAN